MEKKEQFVLINPEEGAKLKQEPWLEYDEYISGYVEEVYDDSISFALVDESSQRYYTLVKKELINLTDLEEGQDICLYAIEKNGLIYYWFEKLPEIEFDPDEYKKISEKVDKMFAGLLDIDNE